MPATPAQRLKTPLRQLRVILGEFGQPLTQEELAARTGLSLGTIRGIENKRRPLSESCLLQIKTKLWARWDDASQHWCPIWENRPYRKDDVDAVAKFWPATPDAREGMIDHLHERLKMICEAIPPGDFVGQVMLINDLLADHARKNELKVDLESTEPIWTLSVKSGVGPILGPEYKEASAHKGIIRTEKEADFSRTYSAPKRQRAKNADKKKTSEGPQIGPN